MKKKNYKSVSNRTTHKTKEHKNGEFTTIPLKLLHDPEICIYAKMLLIQLLSDSDGFSVSASTYAKRMKVAKSTIYKAIEELERLGYIKRTPIGKEVAMKNLKKKGSDKLIYHYTISDFKNPNNLKLLSTGTKEDKTVTPDSPTKEQFDDLINYIESNHFAKEASDTIKIEGVESFDTNINHYIGFLERIEEKIPQIQKLYLDEVKNTLKDFNSSKYPLSLRKKMEKRIKTVIYDEERIFRPSEFTGANNEAQSYWSTLTRKYNSKQTERKMDYETLSRDQAEQEYYDNQ